MTKKNRKRNLYEQQNGLCYWCGVKMIDPATWSHEDYKNKTHPANLATLDHLFEKFTGLRKQNQKYVTVLACKRCNSKRSTKNALFYKGKV